MSGFNEFMDKAGEIATKAAEKAKDLASAAAVRTRRVSRVAKLNMDISGHRDTIKKAYRELGKLYYEAHGQSPEPEMAQLCREIDVAREAVEAMEAEIAAIREQAAADPQDADFEDVVQQTEQDAGVEVEITVEEPAAPGQPQPEEPAAPQEPETPHEEEPRWE